MNLKNHITGDNIYLNSKHIIRKQNQKLETKFF